MIKLSDYVFSFLEKNGVKCVFMLSGGGAMHLNDAIAKNKNITPVPCHHEQTCSMAAEAYAKYTHDLGVANITCGPGSTNCITGVAGAYLDSAPCLFISGQVKVSDTVINSQIEQLRQLGAQEINIIPIVKPITKYAVTILDPTTIKYHLEKAVYLAKSGRPGPSWLDIPLNIQNTIIDDKTLTGFEPSELVLDYKTKPTSDELNELVSLFKAAKRPTIVAGQGVRIAGAENWLIRLCKEFNIPVVTPFLGSDVLSTENENMIGRIGTKGTRAGNWSLQNADLLICVGARLSIPSTGYEYNLFGRESKIVVVDIDPYEHKKKTITIDKFINADAKMFLSEFYESLKSNNIQAEKEWLDKCNYWKAKYPVCQPEYENDLGAVHYYYFVDKLTKRLSNKDTVITDAGCSAYAVPQAIHLKEGQRLIQSGALASMGFNLPAAIGVCYADLQKTAVVITGEGSFQQNIQELQTIKHNNLAVKIFVVNNNGYYSIRQTQIKFFEKRFIGESENSGISFPDLSKISEAYGIKYVKIEKNQQLDCRIDEVMNHDGPVICEVISLPDQVMAPLVGSMIKSDGKMMSSPLEDMNPLLPLEELKKEMFIKVVER